MLNNEFRNYLLFCSPPLPQRQFAKRRIRKKNGKGVFPHPISEKRTQFIFPSDVSLSPLFSHMWWCLCIYEFLFRLSFIPYMGGQDCRHALARKKRHFSCFFFSPKYVRNRAFPLKRIPPYFLGSQRCWFLWRQCPKRSGEREKRRGRPCLAWGERKIWVETKVSVKQGDF